MEPIAIALAYCIDNLPAAEGIEQALSPTRYSFQHYYCKKSQSKPPETLAQQLQHHDGPILLLVSDNFLKSLNCMNQSLKLIQSRSTDIIPVVVDGRKLDEETGEYLKVNTRFEKIGDIIPYINFWQNQYLDLRSQRSTIETESNFDKEGFGEHLRVLRQVSSEASEFLRVLRNMQHYSFEAFSEDHFHALFQYLDDEEEWEAFRAKVPDLVLPVYPAISSDASPEVPEDENLEEIEPDTSTIPGIELLEGRDNIHKIIRNKQSKPGIDPVELPEEPEEKPEEDYPKANPQELFEQSQEDDFEEETDVSDDLLVDEQLGGPAGPEVETEEEQAEDSDPTPENSEEEEEEEEIPFTDEYDQGSPLSLDLSDEFDDQIAEADSVVDDLSPREEEVNADDIIEQAFALANADQLEDAINMMQQANSQFVDHKSLRYYFALLLAQNTSELNNAIHQLDVLLEIDPYHLEGNFLMGELAEIQERYTDAQEHYETVLDIDPAYQDVYARMGIVSLNTTPPDKKLAKKYFKKALKQNAEHVDAHYQYALLVNELKDKPKKAIKYLKKTLALQPQHPFANYDLALLYHQMERPIDAYFYYQKAIAINPELQTVENDAAFSKPPQKNKKAKKAFPQNTASMDASTHEEKFSVEGSDTLTALKANIKKLESLLAEKVQVSRQAAPPKLDKTVLITGATAGIGRATAIAFAENGYRLLLNGRRQERLEDLKTELQKKYQSDILLLPFDVRNVQTIQAAIDNLPARWKNIDVLVNNAGKAKGFAPVHEGELRHWEEMIDVNIKGLLYLTRAVAPSMVARKSGHIINLGSTAGKEVYPNGNVYCATKFAVEALTKAIRLDLYKYNIRVSQVSPGHVEETEFALVRFDGDTERAKIYDDFNPLTSSDVAETIYFIASRPAHVNVQDVLMMGTQQAGSNFIDRSGRMEEEE